MSNLDGEEEPYFPVYFRDFYQYVKYNKDEDPLYLFDPLFADRHEELSTDYQVSLVARAKVLLLLAQWLLTPVLYFL